MNDSTRPRSAREAPEPSDYPLITLAECDAFERHAHYGARADPTGEGVEYALIQPYDLIRFSPREVANIYAKQVALVETRAESFERRSNLCADAAVSYGEQGAEVTAAAYAELADVYAALAIHAFTLESL